MSRGTLALPVIVALSLLASASAKAGDCGPLNRYAGLDLVRTRSGRPVIQVQIGDKPEMLMLDTGGAFDEITQEAAHGLDLNTFESRVRIIGVNGQSAQRYTYLPSLTIGGITSPHVLFAIAPQTVFEPGNPNVIGSLGPDILQRMDVDFDFAAHKVNFIDPDHCDGGVVYWPHAGLAVVPMHLANDDKRTGTDHIIISVKLDGKEIDALIDTGSTDTFMNEDIAERLFGFDPGAPDAQVAGHTGGDPNGAKIYRRHFDALVFEGVAITNPDITIMPDVVKQNIHATPRTGSMIIDSDEPLGLPNLVLGMSELGKLHLYIAGREHKLYLTAATPPAQ